MGSSKVLDHKAFKPLTNDVSVRPAFYDDMSDEEVTNNCILSIRPITSEQNIWAFWHSGWHEMPLWKQRIVIDWVRRQGPSWQIRVLDNVPGSPWHFSCWTSARLYPDFMKEGKGDHWHIKYHSSDSIRLVTLVEHGGVYIDTGTMLFQDIEDICWADICNPASDAQLTLGMMTDGHGPDLVLQAFMAARKGCPFLKAWLRVWNEIWKGRSSSKDISNHPLLRPFPRAIIVPRLKKVLGDTLTEAEANDYIVHGLVASRLYRIEHPDRLFSGARWWRQHARLISVRDMFPTLPGNAGREAGCLEPQQYERLMLPFESENTQDQEQRRTRAMITHCLSMAPMQKLAGGMHQLPTWSRAWDDHPDADQMPGTWGEYFRWARIHLTPHRKMRLYTPGGPGLTGTTKVWKVGLLEPVGPDTETFELNPEPTYSGTQRSISARL